MTISNFSLVGCLISGLIFYFLQTEFGVSFEFVDYLIGSDGFEYLVSTKESICRYDAEKYCPDGLQVPLRTLLAIAMIGGGISCFLIIINFLHPRFKLKPGYMYTAESFEPSNLFLSLLVFALCIFGGAAIAVYLPTGSLASRSMHTLSVLVFSVAGKFWFFFNVVLIGLILAGIVELFMMFEAYKKIKLLGDENE